MEVNQLKRTEEALIVFGGLTGLLRPFFPDLGKQLAPGIVDALVHPIEDKQGHVIKDLRAMWSRHGMTIPNGRTQPPLSRVQQLVVGGLFVQTVEHIQHELMSLELLDQHRERRGHPYSSLRVIGARLMAFKDASFKAFRLGNQDSANLGIHMASAYVTYYTSDEWFGPGNPTWKSPKITPL